MSVGGDWLASNIVAGVMNTASGNAKFGDGNDTSIGAGSAAIVSKIGSVVISGLALGTPNSVSAIDSYGFIAQQVGSLKVGGFAVQLIPGAGNDPGSFVGVTNDLRVIEVAL